MAYEARTDARRSANDDGNVQEKEGILGPDGTIDDEIQEPGKSVRILQQYTKPNRSEPIRQTWTYVFSRLSK